MFFRLTVLLLAVTAFCTIVPAQEKDSKGKKQKADDRQTAIQNATPEQIAESAIIIYGGLLGRQNLNQIRKTTFERGSTTVTEADGRKNTAKYERFVLRGDTLLKEKIRLDQSFPDAKYSLVFNQDRIYAIYNDSVFNPREDASRAFQNQIWHSIDAFLRYKENESKLELIKRDKVMGVDYYIVEMTDKQNRKTRYYVSIKSLRVMMLEYESEGVQYRRRFYDYNYAQGTLVPYRSVLWAGEREVEETDIGTVTFGQKIEDTIFGAEG